VPVALVALFSPARAQLQGRTRLFNPYFVQFQPAWDTVLPDKVKLVDVTKFTENRTSVVMLIAPKKDAPRRTMIVTHWDGFRFATDFSVDFLGRRTDALLAGHFRDPKPIIAAVPAAAATGHKGKSATGAPLRQIITTEGVYEGNGTTFGRIFAAPSNVTLAIAVEHVPEQIIIGRGEDGFAEEVGDVDAHPSALNPPRDGEGNARTAVGVQDPANAASDFHPGVTFMLSNFSGRDKWIIGLARGKAAPTPEDADATTNDHLVVYTPVYSSRDRPFWATRSDDFEESWRSGPIAGRVLDVRVGDPQDGGKAGIVLLTSVNDDKERHLSFFAPVYPLPGAR
jgi:hypothetical protein